MALDISNLFSSVEKELSKYMKSKVIKGSLIGLAMSFIKSENKFGDDLTGGIEKFYLQKVFQVAGMSVKLIKNSDSLWTFTDEKEILKKELLQEFRK